MKLPYSIIFQLNFVAQKTYILARLQGEVDSASSPLATISEALTLGNQLSMPVSGLAPVSVKRIGSNLSSPSYTHYQHRAWHKSLNKYLLREWMYYIYQENIWPLRPILRFLTASAASRFSPPLHISLVCVICVSSPTSSLFEGRALFLWYISFQVPEMILCT